MLTAGKLSQEQRRTMQRRAGSSSEGRRKKKIFILQLLWCSNSITSASQRGILALLRCSSVWRGTQNTPLLSAAADAVLVADA